MGRPARFWVSRRRVRRRNGGEWWSWWVGRTLVLRLWVAPETSLVLHNPMPPNGFQSGRELRYPLVVSTSNGLAPAWSEPAGLL